MKKLILSTLSALFSLSSLFASTSISDNGSYPNFCLQASQDKKVFRTFKRSPLYTPILEHVSFEQGQQYLDVILKNAPQMVALFDHFRMNDKLGKPTVYRYGQYGKFSPTTLRYIKVAADLQARFGSLDNLRIIEIGGGYGGQCTILSKLFNWKEYTIVDLNGPIQLITRYVRKQKVPNVRPLLADNLQDNEEYDLVISNYALTECSPEVQEHYIQKVLKKAKRGYITGNFIGQDCHFNVLSQNDLVKRLSALNIQCQLLPEQPSTFKGNYLVVWGAR